MTHNLDNLRRSYPANFTVRKHNGLPFLYDGDRVVAFLYEESYADVLTSAPGVIAECLTLAQLLKNYRTVVEQLNEAENELKALKERTDYERAPDR